MPEYFALPREDQREALLVAAERSGRPLHLIEKRKDVWVVWALHHLFTGPHAGHLVFKGGTSLSKAYGVIKRFSEDVDLTYDIGTIAPDLIEKADSPLAHISQPGEEVEQGHPAAPCRTPQRQAGA